MRTHLKNKQPWCFYGLRVSAYSLPVEQGRIEMPQVPLVPRHLRSCMIFPEDELANRQIKL